MSAGPSRAELPEDDVAIVQMALDAFSCTGRDDELADRATNAFYRLTHGQGRTPFQQVTDDVTGGCGCACHTGTGYRSSCDHC